MKVTPESAMEVVSLNYTLPVGPGYLSLLALYGAALEYTSLNLT